MSDTSGALRTTAGGVGQAVRYVLAEAAGGTHAVLQYRPDGQDWASAAQTICDEHDFTIIDRGKAPECPLCGRIWEAHHRGSYGDFLASKRSVALTAGVEVPRESLSEWLFPFQRDLTRWALRKRRAAIFAESSS